MCKKKTRFTESVVKTSHGFWKLFQQPILKTSNNLVNVLKHIKHMNVCFKMFNKLIIWYVFKIGCWNNFQKSWLILTTDSVNHVFFTHMKHKSFLFCSQITTLSYINKHLMSSTIFAERRINGLLPFMIMNGTLVLLLK